MKTLRDDLHAKARALLNLLESTRDESTRARLNATIARIEVALTRLP